MFKLSGVQAIEWFLWESVSEGSMGIQKQFELLEVQVIRGYIYIYILYITLCYILYYILYYVLYQRYYATGGVL